MTTQPQVVATPSMEHWHTAFACMYTGGFAVVMLKRSQLAIMHAGESSVPVSGRPSLM
jgi:hypothetical protein